MATVINTRDRENTKEKIPSSLMRFFPHRLREELARVTPRLRSGVTVEEIRLRCDKLASLTTSQGNVMLETVISRLEMDSIMQELCDGSLYAHSEAICQGYITLQNGVRVGICGRAAVENGRVIGVYSVSGLNFRIPARHERVGLSVCELFSSVNSEDIL